MPCPLHQTGRFCLGPFDVLVITHILMRLQHTASDILSRTGRFCLGPFDVSVITGILMRLQHTPSDILSRTGRFCLRPFDVSVITGILMRLQHTPSDILSQTGRIPHRIFCLGQDGFVRTVRITSHSYEAAAYCIGRISDSTRTTKNDDDDDDDDDADGSSDFISTHFLCDVLLSESVIAVVYVVKMYSNQEIPPPLATGMRAPKLRTKLAVTRPLSNISASRAITDLYDHWRCDEQETLPHVLGFCHHGDLLRINRHNTVRSLIASSIRQNASYEVYEEVGCVSSDGSTKRADIIIIDRQKDEGVILDPTIRFEMHEQQPQEEMEDKMRRVSYEGNFKRKVILYAENHENRQAARECGVAKSNIRLWRQHRMAIFDEEEVRKGRHPEWLPCLLLNLMFTNSDLFEDDWYLMAIEILSKTPFRREVNAGGNILSMTEKNCLLKNPLEEMVEGRKVRGRRTYQMIYDIKIYGSYAETKRKAENRKDFRMLGLQ
ncbi:hypothetical protein ANN_25848 [Periplaneta americana]|uniref:Brinker DNA-binding domain-containing protein n=1 Tax=Periplaneta americana TaxID=6978 RepID=A0ABQ8S4U2_PERAM|nr:hypothetical protein ANN_25848 [Periplaneta americana]